MSRNEAVESRVIERSLNAALELVTVKAIPGEDKRDTARVAGYDPVEGRTGSHYGYSIATYPASGVAVVSLWRD